MITMMSREIRLNNLVLPSLNPANLISIDRVLLDRDLSTISITLLKIMKITKKLLCNNVTVQQITVQKYGCNIASATCQCFPELCKRRMAEAPRVSFIVLQGERKFGLAKCVDCGRTCQW